MPQRGVEAVRARHLHPPQRCRAYCRSHDRYGCDLRRRALPVRLELSDREAVDQLPRSHRRIQGGRRTAQPRAACRDLQHNRSAGLSAGAIAAPRIRTQQRTRIWRESDAVGDQDSGLWRYRAGIELPRARAQLRP
ncbi:hypothetical protein chiPu_0033131, partial [Chiloscyllium punctatum]|nr:hypothetical protein [Chiloscyllium punctatum]